MGLSKELEMSFGGRRLGVHVGLCPGGRTSLSISASRKGSVTRAVLSGGDERRQAPAHQQFSEVVAAAVAARR